MKSQENRRVFLVLDLPVSAKTAILELFSRSWSRQIPLKVVPIDNFHITLVFLGNVNASQLPALNQSLKKILVNTKPFPVQLRNISFSTQTKSKVIWIKVQPRPELMKLQILLKKHLQKTGFSFTSRKYQPHITLGRWPRPVGESMNKFKNLRLPSSFTNITWQARAAELWESDLTKFEPRYTCLYRYNFSKK